MLTLLSDEFAPTTSSIGFLEAPFERIAEELQAWRIELKGKAKQTHLAGGLEEILPKLQPLTSHVRPRELVVATDGEWTAYFDCGVQGTDAASPISYMSRRLGCYGLTVSSVPNTVGTSLETPGRHGAVQFELYGPFQTNFGNTVRALSLTHGDSNWSFDRFGTPQDFETADAYAARAVRERFTSAILSKYCEAIGVRPFDASFYELAGVLIESRQRLPKGALSMSFEQAHNYWGIVPGVAEQIPG